MTKSLRIKTSPSQGVSTKHRNGKDVIQLLEDKTRLAEQANLDNALCALETHLYHPNTITVDLLSEIEQVPFLTEFVLSGTSRFRSSRALLNR